MNFISAASSKAIIVAIDEHPMWVYAVDGNYIQPQLVDLMQMYNGERYSVMVKLDAAPKDYTIRMANSLPDQLLSGYATLSYTSSDSTDSTNSTPTINYAGKPIIPSARALNTTSLPPLVPNPPAPTADATHILDLGRFGANWRWSMTNISTYTPEQDSSSPLLYLTDPSSYAAAHPDHIIATKNSTWIDLIVVSNTDNSSNPAQPPHPIHKHANKGYVIGSGSGEFKWESTPEAMKEVPELFNLVDPPVRDSFVTAPVLMQPEWVVFRYQVTEPGAWLLHCHIQTHLVGGMAVGVLDGVDAWPY